MHPAKHQSLLQAKHEIENPPPSMDSLAIIIQSLSIILIAATSPDSPLGALTPSSADPQNYPAPTEPRVPEAAGIRGIEALRNVSNSSGDSKGQRGSEQNPTTPAPSPLFTGSAARALCKLAALAEEWVLCLAAGHLPSPELQNYAAPTSDPTVPLSAYIPPSDLDLAKRWLAKIRRLIVTRATDHLKEATILSLSGRPITDADNRIINLMNRLDPSPELTREERADLRALHTTPGSVGGSPTLRPNLPGALTPPSASSGGAAVPAASSLRRNSEPRVLEAAGVGGVEALRDFSDSSRDSKDQRGSASKPPQTVPTQKPRPKAPPHPNPSKQYKTRNTKPTAA